MDAQLKRGFLEGCVLTVLDRGDSYGYQIIKDVSECIEISESTLYPILKRLESRDMLKVYSSEYNGRLRKYYAINDNGKEQLAKIREDAREVFAVYSFILNGGNENDKN